MNVDKFLFHVDFIVLDMLEDIELSLILSRPFLVTRRALIDVREGTLVLRIQNEQVTFNVFTLIKCPSKHKIYFQDNMIDRKVAKAFKDKHPSDLSNVNLTIHDEASSPYFHKERPNFKKLRLCLYRSSHPFMSLLEQSLELLLFLFFSFVFSYTFFC